MLFNLKGQAFQGLQLNRTSAQRVSSLTGGSPKPAGSTSNNHKKTPHPAHIEKDNSFLLKKKKETGLKKEKHNTGSPQNENNVGSR